MHTNDYSNAALEMDMETSSSESDEDEFREQSFMLGGPSDEPVNEKAVAQQQLLKLARSQKGKNRKKKLKKVLQNGQGISQELSTTNNSSLFVEKFQWQKSVTLAPATYAERNS